jgi:pimeloyl-ACP methyl ester carboxylesterase
VNASHARGGDIEALEPSALARAWICSLGREEVPRGAESSREGRQVSQTTPEIREIRANGMVFRCRVCGPAAGEPIILLHGFPESSAMWARAMGVLAARGYRCLAPDQRGYSSGARPKDRWAYTMDKVASDVVALADVSGFGRFHLVGHDWGAGCGWAVVQLFPERLLSWTALSLPHVAAFGKAVRTVPEQRKKSWYMAFFQLPVLPELALGAGALERVWRDAGPDEVPDYRALFDSYAARRAVLNWYRAIHRRTVTHGDVHVPTLFIWGNKDVAIGRAGVEDTRRFMKGEYTFVELAAGHWLPREDFDGVMAPLLEHLLRHGSGAAGGRSPSPPGAEQA